jgi:hypothetical protein
LITPAKTYGPHQAAAGVENSVPTPTKAQATANSSARAPVTVSAIAPAQPIFSRFAPADFSGLFKATLHDRRIH